eukprot:c11246_g1_i1 orf=3-308(-)
MSHQIIPFTTNHVNGCDLYLRQHLALQMHQQVVLQRMLKISKSCRASKEVNVSNLDVYNTNMSTNSILNPLVRPNTLGAFLQNLVVVNRKPVNCIMHTILQT